MYCKLFVYPFIWSNLFVTQWQITFHSIKALTQKAENTTWHFITHTGHLITSSTAEKSSFCVISSPHAIFLSLQQAFQWIASKFAWPLNSYPNFLKTVSGQPHRLSMLFFIVRLSRYHCVNLPWRLFENGSCGCAVSWKVISKNLYQNLLTAQRLSCQNLKRTLTDWQYLWPLSTHPNYLHDYTKLFEKCQFIQTIHWFDKILVTQLS